MASRVVLADDTDDIRMLLRMFLDRTPDFEVVGEARNGEEAVEQVTAQRPDLVLLDIAMPVMDGLQALPLIRAACPDAKVIMLSGFNADAVAAEAMALGARGYLEKGTPPGQILELLRECAPSRNGDSAMAPSRGDQPASAVVPDDSVLGQRDVSALTDAFAILSHEMLNSITPVVGLTSILEHSRKQMSEEELDQVIEALSRNGRQLQSVVTKFLDAYKVGSDILDLVPEPTDLDQLVDETVRDLRTVLTSHKVSLRATSEATVDLDPTRIRQIISNLVGNAAKFSRDDDPIEVFTMSDGRRCHVRVTDHGPGIAPERLGELFKKHSRLDSPTSGTGIGLFVSREIAKKHGGDVLVESTPGQGSTFTLVLPINQ